MIEDRFFSTAARRAAYEMGRPYAFVVACVSIVVWGASGPYFHYSDTWQLVVNTGTTVATFLMVFLLQHSQNRDTTELNLKLDELIVANDAARNIMLGLEKLTESQLAAMRDKFTRLAGHDRSNSVPRDD